MLFRAAGTQEAGCECGRAWAAAALERIRSVFLCVLAGLAAYLSVLRIAYCVSRTTYRKSLQQRQPSLPRQRHTSRPRQQQPSRSQQQRTSHLRQLAALSPDVAPALSPRSSIGSALDPMQDLSNPCHRGRGSPFVRGRVVARTPAATAALSPKATNPPSGESVRRRRGSSLVRPRLRGSALT